ncbi:ATPase [Adhaeribacter arboris]|uniref:ATPase n=1 Tax=Adhaeribacter arboris TaxID=2072846 RepID=A0A2T2Y9L5_9BACT|nr:ATP-binding protein [Adhaeribacter arboris]PSR52193.1 ATPase [Adhaeribacter arboris]
MPEKTLTIGITGPESTGKSTLAEQLANYYGAVWVPEYARAYLADLQRPYTQADVEKIAVEQLDRMNKALKPAPKLVFYDTELLVLKIWLENAYGTSPAWLRQALHQQNIDLYLLMDVDLPWEPDPQREHPHLRQFFYDWYQRELLALKLNFVTISGSYTARFEAARQQIDKLLI